MRIGNYVWIDTNRNGLQDEVNTGIANANVTLLTSALVPLAWTLTAADGSYAFDSSDSTRFPLQTGPTALLSNCANCYSIRITLPASVSSYTPTINDLTPSNTAINSDVVSVSGANQITQVSTLGDGSFNDIFDAGFVPPLAGSQIGDFVWFDLNGNGIQDGGGTELGIQGVIVQLFDASNNLRASVTTDGSGGYRFSSTGATPAFDPDQVGYQIRIDTNQPALARLYRSPPNVGANDAIDSDNGADVGQVAFITLRTPVDGTNNLTLDFGFAPLRIGDFVWNDANANGLQDSEAGIVGYTLTLRNSSNNGFVGSTNTVTGGLYYFDSRSFPIFPNVNVSLDII